MKTLLILSMLLVLLSGCAYRMDIQQGNILEPDKTRQLRPGLTKEQVRYLLGPPLANTPFDSDMWRYVYYLEQQGKKREEKKLVVYFVGDQMVRVEYDPQA
jgi:outer membrane protein assembly factor BamE